MDRSPARVEALPVDPDIQRQVVDLFLVGLLALGRTRPPRSTIEENP